MSNNNLVIDLRPIDRDRVNEILDDNGLNWTVSKDPFFSERFNIQTPFFGLVRDDNGHYFQSVTETYTPLQNHELMELALRICEETGGQIGDIKKVDNSGLIYVPIHSQDYDWKEKTYIKDGKKRGEKIGENIILFNSHNGSRSFGMTYSHVILSCTNGMTRSDNIGTFTIRHTSNMMKKFKQAMGYYENIRENSKAMFESYKLLNEKPINSDQILHLFDIMIDPFEKGKTFHDYSPITQKNILNLKESLAEEMSYKGQNRYGALNGITHWTTAEMEKSQSRLGSKLLGNLNKKEIFAYNYLMAN